MAAFASSAPLPGRSALVEEEQFQEIVRRSRRLIQKILLSVPDTHAACIRTEVRHSACTLTRRFFNAAASRLLLVRPRKSHFISAFMYFF